MLADEALQGIPLLVYANKMDLPNAMTVPQVTERLGLVTIHDRAWQVQQSIASRGDGLFEGMDWLS